MINIIIDIDINILICIMASPKYISRPNRQGIFPSAFPKYQSMSMTTLMKNYDKTKHKIEKRQKAALRQKRHIHDLKKPDSKKLNNRKRKHKRNSKSTISSFNRLLSNDIEMENLAREIVLPVNKKYKLLKKRYDPEMIFQIDVLMQHRNERIHNKQTNQNKHNNNNSIKNMQKVQALSNSTLAFKLKKPIMNAPLTRFPNINQTDNNNNDENTVTKAQMLANEFGMDVDRAMQYMTPKNDSLTNSIPSVKSVKRLPRLASKQPITIIPNGNDIDNDNAAKHASSSNSFRNRKTHFDFPIESRSRRQSKSTKRNDGNPPIKRRLSIVALRKLANDFQQNKQHLARLPDHPVPSNISQNVDLL